MWIISPTSNCSRHEGSKNLTETKTVEPFWKSQKRRRSSTMALSCRRKLLDQNNRGKESNKIAEKFPPGLAAAEKSSIPKWVANLWFQMASKQVSWTNPSKRSTTSRFFFLFLLTPSKSSSRKDLHSYSGSFLNGKERHCWPNNNSISPFSKPHQILQQISVATQRSPWDAHVVCLLGAESLSSDEELGFRGTMPRWWLEVSLFRPLNQDSKTLVLLLGIKNYDEDKKWCNNYF